MCHFYLVHLYRWTNARCGHRLFAVPGGADRGGRDHRDGHRFLLRRAWRNERHHLYAGGPILRTHLRLFGPRYLRLYFVDRRAIADAWFWVNHG